MEYGADRETKGLAKTLMNDREQTEKLTGEALAVIFGAVKITRCKECLYFDGLACNAGPCRGAFVRNDFYCGYGKPKKGGDV